MGHYSSTSTSSVSQKWIKGAYSLIGLRPFFIYDTSVLFFGTNQPRRILFSSKIKLKITVNRTL